MGFFLVFNATHAAAQVDVSIKPVYDRADGWILVASVTNTSKDPVQINGNALPWSSIWSITLAAVPIRFDPTAIRSPAYIDDARVGPILLPPGGEVAGRIELSKRFPDFDGINKKHSIGLCYRYESRYLLEGMSKNHEGCHVLEARPETKG